jgi:hypothetical protein
MTAKLSERENRVQKRFISKFCFSEKGRVYLRTDEHGIDKIIDFILSELRAAEKSVLDRVEIIPTTHTETVLLIESIAGNWMLTENAMKWHKFINLPENKSRILRLREDAEPPKDGAK